MTKPGAEITYLHLCWLRKQCKETNKKLANSLKTLTARYIMVYSYRANSEDTETACYIMVYRASSEDTETAWYIRVYKASSDDTETACHGILWFTEPTLWRHSDSIVYWFTQHWHLHKYYCSVL